VHVFASFAFAVSPARGFATRMCSCHGYVCSRDVEFGWTPANVQLSTSRAPGHERKLLRCRAALGPGRVGPAQQCAEEVELQCPKAWSEGAQEQRSEGGQNLGVASGAAVQAGSALPTGRGLPRLQKAA